MKATATELRVHSKELLDVVSRGEDIAITFRCRPFARFVLNERSDKTDDKYDLFGIWADRTDIEVDEYVQILRTGRFFYFGGDLY